MITLRPMVMADANQMLVWKNYKETREFAIQSHDEIKIEDHLNWLEKNIQHFQVISDAYEFGEGIAGAVRVHDGEVSIWIDRAFRNKGIATKVIRMVAQQGNIAKIVNGNIGSFKAFVRAGFEPFGYNEEDKFYTLWKA